MPSVSQTPPGCQLEPKQKKIKNRLKYKPVGLEIYL